MRPLRRYWSAALVCLAAACPPGGLCAGIEAPPLKIPFGVAAGNETVKTDLRIRKKDIYTFGLTFRVPDEHDRAQTRALLDMMGDAENPNPASAGVPSDVGVPLTVSIRIERIEPAPAVVVHERTTDRIQRYAGFGGQYLKKIDDVALDRGVYRVTISNLRPAAQLSNLSVHIHINKAYLGK